MTASCFPSYAKQVSELTFLVNAAEQMTATLFPFDSLLSSVLRRFLSKRSNSTIDFFPFDQWDLLRLILLCFLSHVINDSNFCLSLLDYLIKVVHWPDGGVDDGRGGLVRGGHGEARQDIQRHLDRLPALEDGQGGNMHLLDKEFSLTFFR